MKIDIYKKRLEDLLQKSNEVLSTRNRGSSGLSLETVDLSKFYGFRAACLSFIKDLYGINHPYYVDFDIVVKDSYTNRVQSGKEILISIKDELDNGYLNSFRGLVSAEIFSDFMEMSEYLINESYKDPAAVIIGSVLEEHLRQLSINCSIEIFYDKDGISIPKKADRLNSELCSKDIYNKLDQKSITVWLDLRNKAAHGNYDTYNLDQVKLMYHGVLEFISRISI